METLPNQTNPEIISQCTMSPDTLGYALIVVTNTDGSCEKVMCENVTYGNSLDFFNTISEPEHLGYKFLPYDYGDVKWKRAVKEHLDSLRKITIPGRSITQ